MDHDAIPYALILIGTASLTGGTAIYAFRHTDTQGGTIFAWLMLALTEWSALYGFEIIVPTMTAKLLAIKWQYLGVTAIGPLWLALSIKYYGRSELLNKRSYIFLASPIIIFFPLALTNEYHHLIWANIIPDPGNIPGLIITRFGIGFWLHTIIAYALILTGIILYAISYVRSTRMFKKQAGIMIVGSLVPLIGNIIYLTGIFPLHNLDLTPFTFAISGVALAVALFRFGLLDLTPIAAPIVIENLRDAVIVIDRQNRVTDLNPAARQLMGIDDEAIGKDALDILQPFEFVNEYRDVFEAQTKIEIDENGESRWYDLTISPLMNRRDNHLGRVILIHNITAEQKKLNDEQRRTRQLELLNRITRIALETSSLDHMLQTLADQLGKLLEADGAYITLWDEIQEKVIPTAAYGELRNTYPNIQVEPGEKTLTESVLSMREPLAVEDVFNTHYLSLRIAALFPAKSVLALPLIAEDHKVGAVIIGFNWLHSFSAEEIALGEQAAGQIALAIYKAQLHGAERRRATQMSLLEQVSRQISNFLDEGKIIQHTVDALVKYFGFAEAAISMPKEGEMELIAIAGTEDMGLAQGFRQNVGQGIVGHIAETNEAYVTNNISQDPHYFHPSGARSGSAFGVPMMLDEELLGVLYVESSSRSAFKSDDIQMLQTLTGHVVTAIQNARLYERTRDHLRVMTMLQSVAQTITSSLDLNDIFQTVVKLLQETFTYAYVSIYLLEKNVMKLGAQAGYPIDLIYHEIPVDAGVIGRTFQSKHIQYLPNVDADPDFLRASDEIQSEICVPLLKEGKVLGVLNVEATRGHPLTENDVDLLATLAGPVAVAIDNARLHAQAKSLALTDSLCNLSNRRAFDQIFQAEFVRAKRYDQDLALILLDIDSFKVYNDTWGHPAGDKRLIALARLLQNNVRSPDVAARYGGEEFAIILPHTPQGSAIAIAERIRSAAEAEAPVEFINGGPIPGYTISLGVAAYPENGDTPEAILLAADNATLAAKRAGKNRVCAAGVSRKQ